MNLSVFSNDGNCALLEYKTRMPSVSSPLLMSSMQEPVQNSLCSQVENTAPTHGNVMAI
jgi:hypothetical protein